MDVFGPRRLRLEVKFWFMQYCAWSRQPRSHRWDVNAVKVLCLALWWKRECWFFILLIFVASNKRNFFGILPVIWFLVYRWHFRSIYLFFLSRIRPNLYHVLVLFQVDGKLDKLKTVSKLCYQLCLKTWAEIFRVYSVCDHTKFRNRSSKRCDHIAVGTGSARRLNSIQSPSMQVGGISRTSLSVWRSLLSTQNSALHSASTML